MISREQALQIVLEHSIEFGTEQIDIEQCEKRILATDVYADRPFPPFNRVMMDGIAIDSNSILNNQEVLPIEKTLAAGESQYRLQDSRHCVEIMTGAVLPIGCDTVIPFEHIEKIDNQGYKILQDWNSKQNIHREGGDHRAGQILLHKGKKLNALDVNILATVGMLHAEVRKFPKTAIISTGDELVPIEEKPQLHQIRRSNGVMLASYLEQLSVPRELFHVNDTPENMVKTFDDIMQSHDVLILSGGVSKGKFDHVPEVLRSLDVDQLFHRVAQRPGKPFWFGNRNRNVVFGFPGNPISTFSCFLHYFIPWLRESTGEEARGKEKLELAHDVIFKPKLTYFAQCVVRVEDGVRKAVVQHGNGSGDLANPVAMDGFLELPAGKDIFLKGEKYHFVPFQSNCSF